MSQGEVYHELGSAYLLRWQTAYERQARTGVPTGKAVFAFDAFRFYMMSKISYLMAVSEEQLEREYGGRRFSGVVAARGMPTWDRVMDLLYNAMLTSIQKDRLFDISTITIRTSSDTEWQVGTFLQQQALETISEEIETYSIAEFLRDVYVSENALQASIDAFEEEPSTPPRAEPGIRMTPGTPDLEDLAPPIFDWRGQPQDELSPEWARSTPSSPGSPAYQVEREMNRSSPRSPSVGRERLRFMDRSTVSPSVIGSAVQATGDPAGGRVLLPPTPAPNPLDPYAFWRGPHIGYDF